MPRAKQHYSSERDFLLSVCQEVLSENWVLRSGQSVKNSLPPWAIETLVSFVADSTPYFSNSETGKRCLTALAFNPYWSSRVVMTANRILADLTEPFLYAELRKLAHGVLENRIREECCCVPSNLSLAKLLIRCRPDFSNDEIVFLLSPKENRDTLASNIRQLRRYTILKQKKLAQQFLDWGSTHRPLNQREQYLALRLVDLCRRYGKSFEDALKEVSRVKTVR